ncbi:MAG TPA: HEPN domain-containing protein [bacterium]|nr:HEPN domain-containing protein [bacterium]
MTNYSRLLEDRRIEREPAARGQVAQQLSAAQRDLETARGLLAGENEWAYTIAYNAMLLAGRAVMFSEGYRPTTTGGHAAVVEFLRIHLGPSFAEMTQTMDRMRRQRHRITYDAPGTVSPGQIREAVQTAQQFLSQIEKLIGHK